MIIQQDGYFNIYYLTILFFISASSVALALGIAVVVMILLAAVLYVAFRNRSNSKYTELNQDTNDDDHIENTALVQSPSTSHS